MGRGEAEARASLAGQLQARRPEIEQAILTRVHSIADPTEVPDPTYALELRAAVSAALDYGLATVEQREERAPAVPLALLSQARLAARNRVSLDVVLRRYFSGYALLGDFIIEEAKQNGLLGGEALQAVMRSHSVVLDRLVEAVTEEHGREQRSCSRSSERRLAERVERLMAGELSDASELGYRFDAVHLGVVGVGPKAAEALQELSSLLESQLLLVFQGEEEAWAWLGMERPVGRNELERSLSSCWPKDNFLAFGEPGQGIDGWRLTHRQARAAVPFARADPKGVVHYATVSLLASVLRDEVLAASLRQIYLAPLSRERDGGAAMRETLRALIASGNNASSAAAALGVKRHTVTNRLRAVEQHIGRPLSTCTAEVDMALRLEELDRSILPYAAFSRA